MNLDVLRDRSPSQEKETSNLIKIRKNKDIACSRSTGSSHRRGRKESAKMPMFRSKML